MSLTNAEIGPALQNMLVDTGPDGTKGPVDFQTLSVREFGTIYEGLLESSLSVAPSDLALNKNPAYVPARSGDRVVAQAGSIYFHNASGARKATGSYFTKEFAVEHLLRTALDPSIEDHLARITALLDAGKEADAADAVRLPGRRPGHGIGALPDRRDRPHRQPALHVPGRPTDPARGGGPAGPAHHRGRACFRRPAS